MHYIMPSYVNSGLIFLDTSLLSTKLKVEILMHRGLITWFSEMNRRLRILVWRWLGVPDVLLPIDMVCNN
jgi:hypothetical protein